MGEDWSEEDKAFVDEFVEKFQDEDEETVKEGDADGDE